MRLFLIFLLFVLIEYVLQTFVESYKYHTVGLFLEFLPLIVATVLGGLIYIRTIVCGYLGKTYLKLISVSIGGLLTVKAFLFFQWYWFIAPEYRNIPGDIAEGLGWDIFFIIIGIIVILISYLVVILTLKSLIKKLDN